MLNYMRHQWRSMLFAALLTLLFLTLIIGAGSSGALLASKGGGHVDMLAYSLHDGGATSSLLLYDPRHGMSVPLFTGIDFRPFNLSVDGRIALVLRSSPEGNGEIYVLDTLSLASSPVNISQNSETHDYPLAWSPDGHYLAFASYHEDETGFIYVWDGETAINITPDDLEDTVKNYRVAWSHDGRLAFTVQYNPLPTDVDDSTEIYLWDGSATTNLSQNPINSDNDPVWNADGQVAFSSWRNGESDIFVWDGVSIKNGLPDIDTFTNVSSELATITSYPTWTNNGQLAFLAADLVDRMTKTYIWDGQTVTNISQFPTLNNGSLTWSADGRWAFATRFAQSRLYVQDVYNRPLLTAEEHYGPAWSSSGYLMFCSQGPSGLGLSMWDGQQTIEIASISFGQIWAQWQNGAGIVCSSL